MHSLYLFADRMPGGLHTLMGGRVPDDLLQGLTGIDPPALAPTVRADGLFIRPVPI